MIPQDKSWVALLQNRLKEQYPLITVINSSVSGETSGGGLRRLPVLLKQHHPDLIIIELGGNDGLRGMPVAGIRANLEKIIKLSQDSGAKVLLVGVRLPPNYGDTYTNAFFDNYKKVSKQYNTDLVPFFLDKVATVHNLMQEDRIHPTEEAQPILLDTVWTYLNPMLEHN